MAEKIQVIAFLIDTPGGTKRRRAMVKPVQPSGSPSTIEIPDQVTQYLAITTSTPAEGITWRHPLRQ
jgi:hypothetical protein